MRLDLRFRSLIPSFTEHIVQSPKPYFIAPGKAAELMVGYMREEAGALGLALPLIMQLTGEEESALYRSEENASVAAVLETIETQYPGQVFHFLEACGGAKQAVMGNVVIREAYGKAADYEFMIGLSDLPITVTNAEIFKVDRMIYGWVHHYNLIEEDY